MEFGERLKELRTNLNCSQKELSEQTGLTLRTIQRIENNESEPRGKTLNLIKRPFRELKREKKQQYVFERPRSLIP